MKGNLSVLNNGSEVEIRSASKGDASGILNLLQEVYSESELMELSADEAASLSVSELRNQIKYYQKSRKQMMFIADCEGEVVAYCVVSRVSDKERESHRAKLWLAVSNHMRGIGLGSQMMSQAVDFASAIGYEQFEVDLSVGNTDAAILYKNHGFAAAGKLPHAYKNENGSYTDIIKLIKTLQ